MVEQYHHRGVVGFRAGKTGDWIEDLGCGGAPGVFVGYWAVVRSQAFVGHRGGKIRPVAVSPGSRYRVPAQRDIGGIQDIDQAADMITVRVVASITSISSIAWARR